MRATHNRAPTLASTSRFALVFLDSWLRVRCALLSEAAAVRLLAFLLEILQACLGSLNSHIYCKRDVCVFAAAARAGCSGA
jgi:hypothetical protein